MTNHSPLPEEIYVCDYDHKNKHGNAWGESVRKLGQVKYIRADLVPATNAELLTILKKSYTAMVEDFGDPDDYPEDTGSVALGGTMQISFQLMREIREAIANAEKATPPDDLEALLAQLPEGAAWQLSYSPNGHPDRLAHFLAVNGQIEICSGEGPTASEAIKAAMKGIKP